jgi:DNA-directed RNA polymerase specialized sigma24 family protein
MATMPVSEELLAQAQNGNAAAMEALLAESYPSVYRIARAVAGEEHVAHHVVDLVLERSLRVLPTWRRGVIPENWFYHHTLLTARDFAAVNAVDARRDPLVTQAGPVSGDPGYVAFVRALRALPAQQAEAFLLNHGEMLNERLLGVAMDCSATAAEKHLAAASEAMAAIAGPKLAEYTAALHRAYASLTPQDGSGVREVRAFVRRTRRRRFWRRLVRWLVVLVVLGAVLYAAWRWRDRIRSLIGSPTTAPSAVAVFAVYSPASCSTGSTTSCWPSSCSPACC